MTRKAAFAVLMVTAAAAAIFAGCGDLAGYGLAAARPDAETPAGGTGSARTADGTPAPIATAMAQAAAVQAEYATPIPEPATATGDCDRLCDYEFWQNVSVADLDAEIGQGASVNAKKDSSEDSGDGDDPFYRGSSPLHFAVLGADIAVIEALLDRSADLEAVNDEGMTALHFASGLPDARPDVVGLLLERGANANAQDDLGVAPLHFANDTLVAALLLNYGADVNRKTNDGYTRLHEADAALAALLLENGADVNAVADDGYTPLFYAARTNADSVALLLEHGADVNVVADNGDTPLLAVLDRLVDGGGSDGVAILRLLLENGADVDAKDLEGRTACQYVEDGILQAEQSEIDAIRELLCP